MSKVADLFVTVTSRPGELTIVSNLSEVTAAMLLGAASRNALLKLTPEQRAEVLEFVNSPDAIPVPNEPEPAPGCKSFIN